MFFLRKKTAAAAAPARPCPAAPSPIPTAERHFVSGRPLKGPYPEGLETAIFGIGCFWGAERKFWQIAGRLGHGGGLCRRPHAEPDL